MPNELNLYQGAVRATEVDRCLLRIQATPQNTAIPFVWVVTASVTGTAGGSAGGGVGWNEPSGIPYQVKPNLNNCEVLQVQLSNPGIVGAISITASGMHFLNYNLEFIGTGSTDITIYLIENPCDPSNV